MPTPAEPSAVPEERLAPGSNVLVKTPNVDITDAVGAVERTVEAAGDRAAVLVIGYDHTSKQLIEACHSQFGGYPGTFGVIATDELTRSAAAGSSVIATPRVSISTCGMTDVTCVGSRLNEFLADRPAGAPTAVLVDSLTPLVEAMETAAAFQFLHLVTQRIAHAEACGLFHIDPTAHDARTLAVLAAHFDEVVARPTPEPTNVGTATFAKLKADFDQRELECPHCGYRGETTWQIAATVDRTADEIDYRTTCPNCSKQVTTTVTLEY